MKKILLGAAVLAMVLVQLGCDDNAEEKARRLTFENKSNFTVLLIPLTIEWEPFTLDSGQKRTLKGIRNPDFDFKPKKRVKEGLNSTERYVIFVDIEKE